MRYWTWTEVKEKIENDHDLQEEPDILSSGELVGYLNEAIDKCEQHFIRLPDYFLASETITLEAGTSDYDMPTDIYATKIRCIWHDQEDYEVKFLKNLKHRSALAAASGGAFRYLLINNAGDKPKLRILPTPSAAATLTMDYIRNATRITGEDDEQEIDVPEAMGFIFTYMKWRLELKEKLMASAQGTKEDLKQELLDLENALTQRIDDENTHITPETDIYEDHT